MLLEAFAGTSVVVNWTDKSYVFESQGMTEEHADSCRVEVPTCSRLNPSCFLGGLGRGVHMECTRRTDA